MEDYLRDIITDLDRRAAAGQRRAMVVLGLATAWHDEVSPE